ncbi:MAB_1171c family putative transporter [Streptomyces sp. NPDC055078]
MTGRTIGYWTCAVPLWVVFAAKLSGLRHSGRDPMRRAVCATVFSCAAILTLCAPESIRAVNQLSGVPNLAFLINFSLVVDLSAAVRVLIVYWQEPREAARVIVIRWTVAYGLVVVAMTALFWLGDAPVARYIDFETYYATEPAIAAFTLLCLAAQAIAMAGVVRACLRWARLAEDPWLRRGLRLITTGAAFGIGVSALRATAMAARWAGTDWDRLNTTASALCAMAGLTLGALGFALPAWAGRFARLRDRLDSRRGHRALFPLWDALRTAAPTIVLPARIPWWHLQLRLTRRLAEINDGRLAVWQATDERVAARARSLGREAGLPPDELTAVVEAALLKGAIASARTPPHGPPPDTPPRPASASGAPEGMDELAWLTRVARAFADSPVVADAVRTAGPRHPVAGTERPTATSP